MHAPIYQIILGCLIVAVCSIGGIFGGMMIKKGLAEKNNSTSQTSPPSVIKQKSSGSNSPNINAPDAKKVYINYGIPENVFNEWVTKLKGDKGKDDVIEYLLKDLNLPIKNS